MYRGNGDYRRGRKFVPYIRMAGVWQQLGFRRGDRIEITPENERLVLTVVRDDG